MYFGGAEQKSWRELLYANDVRDLSLSFVGLLRRTTKPNEFVLADEFPEDVRIFVDSGTFTLNKAESPYSDERVKQIGIQYQEFIARNRDRIEIASSFDALQLEVALRDTWNDRLQLELGEKYLPIWEPGDSELFRFEGERLGIQAGRSVADYTAQLNRMVMDKHVKLHGVGMTQIDVMRAVRWDSVGSTSWLSPSRNGDTIIWTGTDLKRYPKDYKGQGRAGHRTWLQDNGFNYGLIDADDYQELLRLSIWSWQNYVNHLNRMERVTQMPNERDPETGDPEERAVAQWNRPVGNRKLLPVLGVEYEEHTEYDDEGEEFTVRRPVLRAANASLMQCNSCMIQDRCPEFSPGSSCAFDIPLDLSVPRAEDELWTTMTEIQGQRVLMMRMFEQVNGGGYDPNLGTEIDRLMRIMNARKKQSNTTIRQVTEVSLPGNGQGFITELLGNKAGERLHPQIEDGNTVEAEIINEEPDSE